MEKINNALILCAGYGKRLNPLTLKTPKPLLKVKDICLLETQSLGAGDVAQLAEKLATLV